MLLPRRAAAFREGPDEFIRGTRKAEDATPPGAGIIPKPCPRKWSQKGIRRILKSDRASCSEQAGFSQVRATDTAESAVRISKKWHDAREKRKGELVTAEGTANFNGLQRFLACVHTLTSERRLLRYLYLATKES